MSEPKTKIAMAKEMIERTIANLDSQSLDTSGAELLGISIAIMQDYISLSEMQKLVSQHWESWKAMIEVDTTKAN